MHSDSPQVCHRLQKIHGHGYYRLHHAWTRNNRCNDSAPAPSPARNVLPSASFSMLYFLSLLGLHASRDIHEYSRSLFSISCIYAAQNTLISLSLDSESMGLGMPLLIIQAKNLCKANPPPPTKRPASLRICQGVLAS